MTKKASGLWRAGVACEQWGRAHRVAARPVGDLSRRLPRATLIRSQTRVIL